MREDALAETETEPWIARLRTLMWHHAGLLRDADGLRRVAAELADLRETLPPGLNRRTVEARNLLTVAEAMVACALAREESRGAHCRLDFPGRWQTAMHSVFVRGHVRFVP
jgi:L-aspartate oxidase